jgi:hypothetical protein
MVANWELFHLYFLSSVPFYFPLSPSSVPSLFISAFIPPFPSYNIPSAFLCLIVFVDVIHRVNVVLCTRITLALCFHCVMYMHHSGIVSTETG